MKNLKRWIRAVDGGGDGIRRADIFGTDVRNLIARKPATSIEEFLDFVTEDIQSE